MIAIEPDQIQIDSSSNVVGDTSETLTVQVTDITVPSQGRLIFTLPKQYGSTSMISSLSCAGFAYSGLDGAACVDVAKGTADDSIEITFTAQEGALDFEFQISDFDNPYTTSSWEGFGLEV